MRFLLVYRILLEKVVGVTGGLRGSRGCDRGDGRGNPGFHVEFRPNGRDPIKREPAQYKQIRLHGITNYVWVH
ncbi:hypothetical protein F5Y08DRAFT_77390 [Xylaria arbuscula]|nr:hypothetical protein F5Y08DRAFT_77390 [Xylaria arbuscula]